MTTIQAQLVSDKAVLPREQFERLVELARRSEDVKVQMQEDDVPTLGIMLLAEEGGAFDWLADDEELYTVNDLKVRPALVVSRLDRPGSDVVLGVLTMTFQIATQMTYLRLSPSILTQ